MQMSSEVDYKILIMWTLPIISIVELIMMFIF